MPLNETKKTDAMRQLVKKMFVSSNTTANLSTADIKAAVDKVDEFLNDKSALQLNNDGAIDTSKTLAANLNAYLPEPFQSTATLQQKTLLLSYWAMKLGGVI